MLALGCDHGGFALMQTVIEHLKEKNIEFKNFGTFTEDSCDYPAGECSLGILICGTGIGMSMAANKVRGIRAALCTDTYSAEMTRRHNDANILVLGGRVTGAGHALKIVDTFLETAFEGGRHARRISMFTDLESRL